MQRVPEPESFSTIEAVSSRAADEISSGTDAAPVVAASAALVPAVRGKSCEDICSAIASRFGFNMPASADDATRSAVQELQRGWARAIQRLAAELYAKDTHFVLELVQNADDNAYPDGVLPTLEVHLDVDGVSFSNNERGFSEENVWALCSVGESTKAASDIGYIGHKGIGFKSVFKVTPTPEIHSRGFHFGFDARPSADGSGALGYIVPTPLPEPANWDAEHGGTLIRLPFVPRGTSPTSAVTEAAASLAASFRRSLDDVRPNLLLFLHRLRRLHFVDDSAGVRCVRTMTRVDEVGGIVALSLTSSQDEAEKTERWAVFSIILPAQVERAGVARTELSIALPLLPLTALTAPGGLVPQEVFAFLPLRSFGFRFVLQGDWIVPSSREAVDQGSAWNEWLREEGVPAVFLSAVDTIVARYVHSRDSSDEERITATALLNTIIASVPLPGQVTDFFAPVVPALLAKLRVHPFIPTTCNRIIAPCCAVLAAASGESDSATTAEIVAALGCGIVSTTLLVLPDTADALGIRRADSGAWLTEMLCAAAMRWRTASDCDVPWLAWALDALSSDATLSSYLPRLASARFLPLSNGDVASPDSDVFMLNSGVSSIASSELQLLPGVRTLAPTLQAAAEARRGISRALARLGVAHMEGSRFVHSHLVPALSAPTTPPEHLPGLLAFARRHGGDEAALAASLRSSGARLLCASGETMPCSPSGDTLLHLSAAYAEGIGGSAALPPRALLPEVPWPYISDAYAQLPGCDGAAAWASFFTQRLGLLRFVAIRRESFEAPVAQLRALGNDWREALSGVSDDTVIDVTDFVSEELHALCTAAATRADCSECVALLTCLSKHWSNELCPAALATLQVTASGSEPPPAPMTVPSSLSLSLRTPAWLPAGDGKLRAGSSLFAKSAALQSVLGGGGPWFAPPAKTVPPALVSALGVRSDLSPSALLHHVSSIWAGSDEFECSLRQMAAVHAALLPATSVDSRFLAHLATTRWVWVPLLQGLKENKRGGLVAPTIEERIMGRFYTPSECVLDDMSWLIDGVGKDTISPEMMRLAAASGVRVLNRFYRDAAARETLASLGIPATPATCHYLAVLDAAASGSHMHTHSVTAAMRVLCNWAYADSDAHSDDEGEERADEDKAGSSETPGKSSTSRVALVLADLAGHAVFPNAAGGWTTPEELRFVDDTAPCGRLPTICGSMLHAISDAALATAATTRLPEGAIIKEVEANLRRFYVDGLRIPLLSTAARETCTVVGAGPPLPAESNRLIRIAALVLQRWSLNALEAAARETLYKALQQMQVIQCETITPEMRLASMGATGAATQLPPEPIITSSPVGFFLNVDSESDAKPHLYVANVSSTQTSRSAALAAQLGKLLLSQSANKAIALLQTAFGKNVPGLPWDFASQLYDAFCTEEGLPPRPDSELTPWLSEGAKEVRIGGKNASEDSSDLPARLLANAIERNNGVTDDDELTSIDIDAPSASAVLQTAIDSLRARATTKTDAKATGFGGGGYPSTSPRPSADSSGMFGTGFGGGGGSGGGGGIRFSSFPPVPHDLGSGGERSGDLTPSSHAAGKDLSLQHTRPASLSAVDGPSFELSDQAAAGRASWEVLQLAPGHTQSAQLASLLSMLPRNQDDSGMAAAVGRAGEAYVAQLLVTLPQYAGARICWHNRVKETGLPFDIDVRMGDERTFVEVKTSTTVRDFFDVSLAELEHARRHSKHYHIYRVFPAAEAEGSEPRLVVARIADPVNMLTQGDARLLFLATPSA
jgi:hypothetical protein